MAVEIINERGEIMEPAPGMTIPVERNNPLFNDADKFFQDLTFPGTAPFTPNNKRFFNNGHLVDALNEKYEFAVQVIVNGTPFFAGRITYKVVKNGYNFQLLVNFGAVADKVRNTRLTELRTNDANYQVGNTDESFEDFMKNTCESEWHPYVFCPVSNPLLAKPGYFEFINHFDYPNQRFKVGRPVPLDSGIYFTDVEIPFYRLHYILKKVLKYIGFDAYGGFFDDNEAKKILIYSRRAINYEAPPRYILPSSAYLPNITVSDFLRQIRARLGLSFDFNTAAKQVHVESFDSILYNHADDLSQYVESIEEMEVPAKKGYTISLVPDETDQKYKSGTQQLIIGDGSEKIEIDCSTLASDSSGTRKYAAVSQKILKDNQPDGFSYSDENDPTTRNNWPLRLFKYNGMVPIDPGKFWPESQPLELTASAGNYYRFLNDSKFLKIIANIPPYVLAKMSPTGRFHFVTEQGTYTDCLIKRISYELGESNGLIRVKIEAHTLRYQASTPVSFRSAPTNPNPADVKNNFIAFKAFFSSMEKVEIKMTTTNVNISIAVPDINLSSDESGAGGDTVWAKATATSGINLSYQDIPGKRIKLTQRPKYAEHNGRIFSFTQASDHWFLDLDDINLFDRSAMWIVF